MPARGRRSAKPFTRRRSAAAFRLRPPVPRMNLSPNRGREDGAAVRPGPPGVVRLRPLLAGRQVLPGYGYGCPFGALRRAFRSPFRRLRRCSFFGGLLPKAFFGGPSFGYGAAFLCPAEQPGPAPSRLCLLSAPTPLRSAPSPSRPVPSPFRPRSCPVPVPVPVPALSRPVPSLPRPCPCPCPCPCPVPVPFLSRSCPVPVPSLSLSLSLPCPVPVLVPVPVPVPVPFLSRSCPVSVPFLSRSCPLSAPSPLRSVPFPSRSCLRPLFWRGAASSLFFGPRVEKPEKLFRFVISK